MALSYSATVRVKKGDTIQGQTFFDLYSQIDDDESIQQFGTAYAALFDSDTQLVESYCNRKRSWSASND